MLLTLIMCVKSNELRFLESLFYWGGSFVVSCGLLLLMYSEGYSKGFQDQVGKVITGVNIIYSTRETKEIR